MATSIGLTPQHSVLRYNHVQDELKSSLKRLLLPTVILIAQVVRCGWYPI